MSCKIEIIDFGRNLAEIAIEPQCRVHSNNLGSFVIRKVYFVVHRADQVDVSFDIVQIDIFGNIGNLKVINQIMVICQKRENQFFRVLRISHQNFVLQFLMAAIQKVYFLWDFPLQLLSLALGFWKFVDTSTMILMHIV